MEPIKQIKTVLDVIEEVERIKKINTADPHLWRLVQILRENLYVDVLRLLSQSCSEFVRDLAVEALNAEDIRRQDNVR